MEALYTAEATAYGEGRNGEVRSSDGVIDEVLSVPKEMGGPGGDATNPEQLFAAGYSACFNSAIAAVARAGKIQVASSEVTAKVGIGSNGAGGFQLAVELAVKIPGLDQAVAEKLVEQAHQVCPYSNATRGNIEVALTVTV
ncbi:MULTISPECIES: organic hydroperoxide resistance protein [Lentzea]|uniref:Organic hydroperoxide resistance protein n=3 Tax=Lentzea TaxID=165301 RepID=A0A1B2HGL6_9PSEU|nr:MULTISPECIES: organic hydroperoxide resistance protein [Lentzea]ANZ36853.1 organic hydroperoxide resistance protein [Lentzea guizhouensis]MDX8143851.1 organic hydroperoxide resistance protein [Lentzea sp. BCCO 10_0061]WVH78674.1 organic hydroperoxide resistance protein [Lentzea sp. DG1S-22]GGM98929.1 organic hydroperoxide resistance protein [Lentzea pudingi]